MTTAGKGGEPGGATRRPVVVVPTYDEASNVGPLVEQLLALPEGLSVVLVDDASPDGTGEVADALAARHPGRVWVIHRGAKKGLGTAYLEGMGRALSLGATDVLTMDADFSHDPSHVPALLLAAAEADVVIGSRYVAGGGVLGSPPVRRFLSRGANLLAHAALGLATRDATAGFRLHRREPLEALPLGRVLSSGYSFPLEMTFLAERAGFRVTEVPILFRDRRHGRSKISRVEILRAAATVVRLALRRVSRRGR